MNQPLAELGWVLTRLAFGISLTLLHGYPKIFGGNVQKLAATVGELGLPFPLYSAWAAASIEFFGGIFLALGLLTRPAAALVSVVMAVAMFSHSGQGFAKMELAFLYLAMMVLALCVGGGRFSLDTVLGIGGPPKRRSTLL